MQTVRIYKPTKTAMQSGRGLTKEWRVEFEPTDVRRPEPLMGWISSGNTQTQVHLSFETKEEALAYAERMGYRVVLQEPKPVTIKVKSYADNFRPDRIRS